MKINSVEGFEFIKRSERPFLISVISFVVGVIILQYKIKTNVADQVSHLLILIAILLEIAFSLVYRKLRKKYS
jgi:hypothetical protein